jgi:hypothetical protein
MLSGSSNEGGRAMAIVGFHVNVPIFFQAGEWVAGLLGESTPSDKTWIVRHVSGEIETPQGQVIFALTFMGHVYRVTHSGDLGGSSYWLIDSPSYDVIGPNAAPLIQASRSSALSTAGGMIHYSGEVVDA